MSEIPRAGHLYEGMRFLNHRMRGDPVPELNCSCTKPTLSYRDNPFDLNQESLCINASRCKNPSYGWDQSRAIERARTFWELITGKRGNCKFGKNECIESPEDVGHSIIGTCIQEWFPTSPRYTVCKK